MGTGGSKCWGHTSVGCIVVTYWHMCKICRVKVISCENGKILMITGAMDGCEVCIRLNRTACGFVIICCMCVTLCVCVCVCVCVLF